MTSSLRAPVDETRKLIERTARDVARLALRRARQLRDLDDTEQQLRAARRLLRQVIQEAVPPASLVQEPEVEGEL